MLYLFIVTLIWAFSFGLIKDQLTSLDSNFVAFVRMGISFLVFLPFLQIKKLSANLSIKLIVTGAIQYGVMYAAYIYSYQFLLFLGAVLTTGLFSAFTTSWVNFTVSQNQIFTLLYLGAVASGIGFFLWNVGARRVNAGTLAVFNNIKVPFAIFVAILFFGEQANIPRLLSGSVIIFSALLFNEYYQSKNKQHDKF